MPAVKPSSQWTLSWREKDSNHRSRVRERFSRLPRLSSPSRRVARGTAASNLYSATAEYDGVNSESTFKLSPDRQTADLRLVRGSDIATLAARGLLDHSQQASAHRLCAGRPHLGTLQGIQEGERRVEGCSPVSLGPKRPCPGEPVT